MALTENGREAPPQAARLRRGFSVKAMSTLTVTEMAPRIGRFQMWKRILVVLSFLVGLGLFIFIIEHRGGFRKALEAVAAIGWMGVAVFILNAAGTLVFPAMGWWILMRGEGVKVPPWTAFKANFMGFPINFIAPSMYL